MEKRGYVYILTNPSFKEDWIKIGKSSRPIDIRCKELDNTAVPLPFEIFATLQTEKYHQIEKLIHKSIDRFTDLRIRQNREFFNVPPQTALDILRDLAQIPDDAILTEFKDNKPYKQYSMSAKNTNSTNTKPSPPKCPVKSKKPPFKFSIVDIKIGEELIFIPTGIKVYVAG